MAGLFNRNFSPARPVSPLMRNTPDILSESQYLQELLTERQKLAPFMPVLPICTHLLNQVFGPSPWNANGFGCSRTKSTFISCEENSKTGHSRRRVSNWRLLGPRGNSLKRVEAQTGCRVYIRGQGSIKDPEKEEKLKGKPGYEHLKDPLHILIEAELPKNIVDMKMRQAQEIIEELLKPVDESQDAYKRQQLRELALLNSSEKEDGLQRSTSASSFSNNGTAQANGGQ